MAINKLIVGYKNANAEQIGALEDVLEFLDDVEPIDQLIGTPETPVPEDVDFWSLLDLLAELVKKAKQNKTDIHDHEQRISALE